MLLLSDGAALCQNEGFGEESQLFHRSVLDSRHGRALQRGRAVDELFQQTVFNLSPGKNRLFCSLSEGDMIHDMLRMEYEQVLEEIKTANCRFIRAY